MPESHPPLFLPSSIEEVIAQISALSLNEYDILRNDIQSVRGFNADQDRCEALAKPLNLTAENIAILLSALSFLYNRINSSSTGANFEAAVSRLFNEFDNEIFSSKAKEDASYRLRQLIYPTKEIELSRKIKRLKTGFLNNATSFTTFADLRPDFTEENKSIRGFVPIIQFKISTDSTKDFEKEFVFQVDEAGLKSLKAAIESAETKLQTLDRGDATAAPIYNQKPNANGN